MSHREPAEKPKRDHAFTAVFALVAVATACAAVLIVTPRALEPVQLPPLVLERAQVDAALARDRAFAGKASSDRRAHELYGLYLEEGQAERQGQAGLAGATQRRSRVTGLVNALFPSLGQAGICALRARATQRFMLALTGELDDPQEAAGLLGTFPDVLRRYGLLDEQGRVRAPELSVRAMYKARWNIIHELEIRQWLEPVEIQAYEGWNALHAAGLKPEKRAQAARLYHEAGGKRSAEALATWLYQGGYFQQAASLLGRAYKDGAELRVRNMELAVKMAMLAP